MIIYSDLRSENNWILNHSNVKWNEKNFLNKSSLFWLIMSNFVDD